MTFIQHLRRPLRYAIGVFMIVLAVSILCLTVGQSVSANTVSKSLEYQFTTIALPAFQPTATSQLQQITELVQSIAAEQSGPIKQVSKSGLASAYIPELTPDNYTDYVQAETNLNNSNWNVQAWPLGAPYCTAMLEITLTEISDSTNSEGEIRISLTGIIDRVIELQEGYSDPTGFKIGISLTVSDRASLENLSLVVGEKYLVYGLDYQDREWHFRSHIASALQTDMIDSLDPNALLVRENVSADKYKYDDGKIEYVIPSYLIDTFHSAYMSIMVGPEMERYREPTIAHLTCTAEEFLLSDEGTIWQDALERMEINNHAFPLIGVEKLSYIADFARENARVVEGRDFAQEELNSGAKVCIISQTIAAANGIEIGDTISPQFYNYDYNVPYQNYLSEGIGLINPAAYYYTSTTLFAEEIEKYTVIGLYRQNNAWCAVEENPYSFTPNTIFVPKGAITSSMEQSEQGLFYSIVLKNGTINEFERIAANSGYDGLFAYYDQGYSVIEESIHDYQALANRALIVGITIYCVVLFLFLMLYPGQEGKTLRTMASLGATNGKRAGHVFGSAFCVLLPGTILGVVVGIALWDRVVTALLSAANTSLTLELDPMQMCLIGTAQLLVASLLTGIMAVCMTRGRSFIKRK